MLAQSFSYRRKIKKISKFQFVEQNSVECWCDFGANLVQHFIGRYSRYSRYRTKSHDKATISHDILRYSRYQTVLSKLQEIICFISYTKSSASAELFVVCRGVHCTPAGDHWSPLQRRTVQFVKNPGRPIYFLEYLWYNHFGGYLLDKLEFVGGYVCLKK